MYTTILVLMMIAAVLLVIIVLMQNPKGGGISGEFGGGSTSQMFGVQRTGDLLEQLSWGFFAFLVVGALATSFFVDKTGSAGVQDNGLNVEKAQTRPAPAPSTVPATAPANNATKPATAPAQSAPAPAVPVKK